MKKLILAATVLFTILTVSCGTKTIEVEVSLPADSISIDSTITTLDSLPVIDTIAK